jgi:hypothetical protein
MAYLELRDHPHQLVEGNRARSVYLHELIDDYDGPRLRLDFDKHNQPIGLEIQYPLDDHDGEMILEPLEGEIIDESIDENEKS